MSSSFYQIETSSSNNLTMLTLIKKPCFYFDQMLSKITFLGTYLVNSQYLAANIKRLVWLGAMMGNANIDAYQLIWSFGLSWISHLIELHPNQDISNSLAVYVNFILGSWLIKSSIMTYLECFHMKNTSSIYLKYTKGLPLFAFKETCFQSHLWK